MTDEPDTLSYHGLHLLLPVLLLLALALPVRAGTPGATSPHLAEAAKYRLEFDNDLFVGSDNQFSSGWSLQYHSATSRSWDRLDSPTPTLARLGVRLPGLNENTLYKRHNLSIGQIIQTPARLSESRRIENDVPYAAVLAVQSTWTAYNDEAFQGIEISLGITGPAALGEPAQNAAHRVLGINEAKGWDNQLGTEPVFNLNYMRKIKFYRGGEASGLSWDAALDGHAAVGTLFTLAAARLETRLGRNMPRGFTYYPDPIGHSMIYDATLAPPIPGRSSQYVSVTGSAIAIGHNLLLDGTVFRRSQRIDKEPYLFMLNIGFHYETAAWGAHMDWTFTTDTVETASLNAAEDADNAFGTLMFEWKI
ncbi:MAG TPA: lipid A deacylase LpxR family protein [Gammaproteobacteria bacterium]|nr:lipid A deacylase LpxR family protein [Gammaproteobacteria bacterium]